MSSENPVSLQNAGIAILEKHLDTIGIVCEDHTEKLTCRLLTIVCHCFFNSQRKRSNEALNVDQVAAFKANERRKLSTLMYIFSTCMYFYVSVKFASISCKQ